jgi:hypothetical protein
MALHKGRLSVSVPDAPELSFNSSHVTDEMASISSGGDPSAVLKNVVGTVTVHESSIIRVLSFTLDKTQVKAGLWMARIKSDCAIGDVYVQGLAANVKETLRNCTITKYPDDDETGRSQGFTFEVTGTVLVNTGAL